MGSSRLPGKVLSPVFGKPMLQWQLERLKRSRAIDRIVVATSTLPADDPLAEYCLKAGWRVFRGDESDVLGRFMLASLENLNAQERESAVIVRLTGDCPLVDPAMIDEGIEQFARERTGGCRYLGYDSDLPDGMDFEIFSWDALREAAEKGRDPFEREHVTPYLWRNPELFGMKKYTRANIEKGLRFSVDYPEDRNLVEEIFRRQEASGRFFGIEEISNLLQSDSQLRDLNSQIIKNEGLLKTSLASPAVQVAVEGQSLPGYGVLWEGVDIDADVIDWCHSMGIQAWSLDAPARSQLLERYESHGWSMPHISPTRALPSGWSVIRFEGDWKTALREALQQEARGKLFLAAIRKYDLALMLTYIFHGRFSQ